MIRCENLTRYFGSFVALDRLTLEIPQGSVCAMVGPNGAGKSTTMKMLTTLLAPSRGRAWIGGRDIVQDRVGVRQLIGYLPESFQLYEDMSVERYLQFFARAYNLDNALAGERVGDYLERLGLTEKRHARVGTLSRGMRQRLGVAKSFLHDPQVVFLDEPASGLDPVARGELRDFLKFQQHLGKTVVVSSHVLKELADFCDHIAIIQHGRLMEFGPLAGSGGVLARYTGVSAGGRRYTLRVARDAVRLEEFLQALGGVSNLERRDATLAFDFDGDEEAAARVLAQVTAAGYLVTRFMPEEADLEAVYRKASAGGRAE
ncbi:MAG: ABC transporter ATP-binding protein [Planctomycetota bacterium]|nr:ABC transporter ATP-binding protein [Planctomycetota bacterium]